MDKNTQMTPVKEVYEKPVAEVSTASDVDVLTLSSSLIGQWDSQNIMRNFNF